jgi:hypothetical protein
MQPAPAHASQNIPSQQANPSPSPSSQHGQLRDDDLQDSAQPHSGELRGEPEPQDGGDGRDATRSDATSDDGSTAEALGLRPVDGNTPPPRNRISEYENARVTSPRKPAEGPLFEVIKTTRKPDDKSSPIAKLPNGECQRLRASLRYWSNLLTQHRGLDSRHCPSLAERPRRRVPCLAPLQ